MLLQADKCFLVVIDIQGKLAESMYEKERLLHNVRVLIQAAGSLCLEIVWCEQAPSVLGPTVRPVAELLEGTDPIAKTAFSCCGEPAFNERVERIGRQQALLCGIESHVCVCQTAADLVLSGRTVYVVQDAVSSRTPENRKLGLELARSRGAGITSVEAALFEMLKTAGHPAFRRVSRLIR